MIDSSKELCDDRQISKMLSRCHKMATVLHTKPVKMIGLVPKEDRKWQAIVLFVNEEIWCGSTVYTSTEAIKSLDIFLDTLIRKQIYLLQSTLEFG